MTADQGFGVGVNLGVIRQSFGLGGADDPGELTTSAENRSHRFGNSPPIDEMSRAGRDANMEEVDLQSHDGPGCGVSV